MYSKRLIILILSFILIGTITSGKPDWAIGKEDIVIGIITPMSGPAADFGVTAREGTEEVVSELNAAGGVLGRSLKVIYRDDESNPQKGVSSATEFVSGKKVHVIMGGMSTPVAMAISPIINDAKMIFMTFGTGTPLTDINKYPYNFRMKYYTAQEAKLIVDYAINRKGFKKVGVMADTSAYGKIGKDDLTRELESVGTKPVGIEQYNWGDTDMTGQLLKLRQAGAEVLLLWGMGQDLAQVARSAQKMGWTVPTVGSSGIVQLGFGKLAGEAGKDWWGTIYKRVSFTEKEPISKDILEWLDRLEQKYGKNRKTLVGDSMVWADQIRVYANAVKRAGTTDSEKVRVALEATKGFKGFLSNYSFSPTNHDGMRLEDLTIVYPASVQRNAIFKRAPDAP
jgi:branched-chain amino acid transport system substrate-binding protein